MPARRPDYRDDIVYDDDFPCRETGDGEDGGWKGERSRQAARVEEEIRKRREAGEPLRPEIPPHQRNLSNTFWGQAWNRNLMACSAWESRLPKGRTTFRSGKVMDLEIRPGWITATVAGTRIYGVRIAVAPVDEAAWAGLRERCQGQIGGLVELFSGQLSDAVMREVSDPERGLFPGAGDLKPGCSCPDDAGLCRHAAAALYAAGCRFDAQPALLFTLRGVAPSGLVPASAVEAVDQLTAPAAVEAAREQALQGVDLGGLFGLE